MTALALEFRKVDTQFQLIGTPVPTKTPTPTPTSTPTPTPTPTATPTPTGSPVTTTAPATPEVTPASTEISVTPTPTPPPPPVSQNTLIGVIAVLFVVILLQKFWPTIKGWLHKKTE